MPGLWRIDEDVNSSTVSRALREESSEIDYEELTEISPRTVQGPNYRETPLTSVYNEILVNPKYDPNYGKNYQYNYIDAEGAAKPEIFIINYRPAIPSSAIPRAKSSKQAGSLVAKYWKYTLLGFVFLLALVIAVYVIRLAVIHWVPSSVVSPPSWQYFN